MSLIINNLRKQLIKQAWSTFSLKKSFCFKSQNLKRSCFIFSRKNALCVQKNTIKFTFMAFASETMTSNYVNKTSVVGGLVQSDVKLSNKTVIVTGANTGIGYETALDLARRKAKVIVACRNLDKGNTAKINIKKQVPDANVVVMKLDLASLTAIHEFVDEFLEKEDRLDILINNAGIMACPEWKTKDGFEMQLGVNHIGHFLLTKLLLDTLKKSSPSRIVIVSSALYKRAHLNWEDMAQPMNYDPQKAYAVSKLSNILHCRELSKQLEGTGVTCNVLHPGMVNTDLGRHIVERFSWFLKFLYLLLGPVFRFFFMKAPIQGSQTTIYCAIAPELENVSGKYFGNCREDELLPHAMNDEDAKKLWNLSEEWISKKIE